MVKVIGRCSKCGGDVVQTVHQKKPVCLQCGASKKDVLPIIEMDESTKPELLLES